MKAHSRLVLLLISIQAASPLRAADVTPAPASATADPSLLGLVVPLIATAIAVAALWWMMRRNSGRSGAAGPARIVQVIAVGPRERIVVLDHDTRRFVLGVTATAINTLAELESKDAAKIPPIASASLNGTDASTRG